MMKNNETILIGTGLIFLEVSLLLALFTFLPNSVIAGVGSPSTTVITNLTVGNTFPDVVAIELNGGSDIDLTPNTTTLVSCIAIIRDYNNDSDVDNVNATLFDAIDSSSGDSNDNNYHYTNSSCQLTADAGVVLGYPTDDAYHSLANCTFQVQYNANPSTWTCHITANDSMSWSAQNSTNETVNQLLALALPDAIEYGTINATEVSFEQVANITNVGNTQFNLTLEAHGSDQTSDVAMNCTLGNIGYIPTEYEKYNLTASNPGTQTLTQFEASYTNITNSAVTETFNLNFQQDEGANEAVKESYWRIYVPKGVAGTCNGTIIFGATV